MGFSAIGLIRPKTAANIGGTLRAAHCYGASAVIIVGDRSGIRHPTNVSAAHLHIPIIRGDNVRKLVPFGAVPVAVELTDGATPLPWFNHPEPAFYIFGPEDGTLGKSVLDWCPLRVAVPTAFCMNLAATVNVILYDRMAKAMRGVRRGEGLC